MVQRQLEMSMKKHFIKNNKHKLESKIVKIEEVLSNQTLFNKHDIDTNRVNILTNVKFF